VKILSHPAVCIGIGIAIGIVVANKARAVPVLSKLPSV